MGDRTDTERGDFHPDLRGAWWLPRQAVSPWNRRLWRAFSSLLPWLPHRGERAVLPSGAAMYVYRPAGGGGGPHPAMLWIHGGGMVVGHGLQDEPLCAELADELGIVVASVDYRLAPGHPFPTPVEDVFEALQALAARADVRADRVAVGGQSAGGGLAAGVSLLARERGVPVVFQVLIYPMLDPRTSTSPPGGHRFRMWSAAANRFGWASYLAAVDAASAPCAAAPALCADLSGLPPAWVGVGTLDLFYDEDVAYAERLRADGVPCTLEVVDGGYHAFDAIHRWAPVARAFRASWVAALKAALFA